MLLLLSTTFQSYSQPTEFSDDIKEALQSQPSFWVNYHSSYSFVSGNPITVRSVIVGLSFNRKLKLGIGYNWLKDGVHISNEDDQLKNELQMNYLALNAEYLFYSDSPWSFSIPVQIGGGTSYLLEESTENKTRQNAVLLYEPNMLATFHFLDYFSVSAGVGLRLMLLNNDQIERQFNSPIFMFRFQIDFRKMYDETM